MLGECYSLGLSRYFCQRGSFGQCLTQMHNAQWRGERRPKGRENFLRLNFLVLPLNVNLISHNHERSQCEGKSETLGWQSRQVWRYGTCLLAVEFFFLIPIFIANLFVFVFFGCTACGILVPQPGIKPTPPSVEAQSLNHWTSGKSC